MSTRQYSRNREESEKSIEAYLRERVKGLGGLCLKYENASQTGYPDRVILIRDLQDIWVELKSRGENPTKLQALRISRLRALGRNVYIAASREDVDRLISCIRDLINVAETKRRILYDL